MAANLDLMNERYSEKLKMASENGIPADVHPSVGWELAKQNLAKLQELPPAPGTPEYLQISGRFERKSPNKASEVIDDGFAEWLKLQNTQDVEPTKFETEIKGEWKKPAENKAGLKHDQGKPRLGLVFNGFSKALTEVGRVGTFGAEKYTPNGWVSVPNAQNRYTDAMYRHLMSEQSGELWDKESNLFHAAHAAWNALARLELLLRETDKQLEEGY